MALSLLVGDVLAFRVWCTLDNQASVNTYNYLVGSVVGGGITDQNASDAFDTLINAFYKGITTTSVLYQGVQTYFIRRTFGSLPAPVKSVANGGFGLQAPPTLPPNTAAIMKYNTFERGPGGRGRVYLPFIASLLSSAFGTFTVAMDVAVNSLASALLSPLVVTSGGNSATLIWSLVARHPSPAPVTTRQIIGAQSAGIFGQMHKRGSYGRANSSPI